MAKNKNFNYGRKIAFLGLAALVLSFGLVLASCDTATTTSDNETAASTTTVQDTSTRTVQIVYNVNSGGNIHMLESEGVVFNSGETYLAYNYGQGNSSFTVSITIPVSVQSLFVYWKATSAQYDSLYLNGWIFIGDADTYTVDLTYNGYYSISYSSNYNITDLGDRQELGDTFYYLEMRALGFIPPPDNS